LFVLWLRDSNSNSNNKSNEIKAINRIGISVDRMPCFQIK